MSPADVAETIVIALALFFIHRDRMADRAAARKARAVEAGKIRAEAKAVREAAAREAGK